MNNKALEYILKDIESELKDKLNKAGMIDTDIEKEYFSNNRFMVTENMILVEAVYHRRKKI